VSWDVISVIYDAGTDIPDEPAASIIYPEDRGSTFSWQLGRYLPNYMAPHFTIVISMFTAVRTWNPRVFKQVDCLVLQWWRRRPHQARSGTVLQIRQIIGKLGLGNKKQMLVNTYSFVNRNIKSWNQLRASLPASFPCKLNTFIKTVKNVVITKGIQSGDWV